MSACHHERTKALSRILVATERYDVLFLSQIEDDDWSEELKEAEKELFEACRALAQLPDCSD